MKQIEILFRKQKGVCPWCGYTMMLGWYSYDMNDIDAAATIDHLVPIGSYPRKRPAVAAHRVCNNERGHDLQIRPSTLKTIEKSVMQFGLTKNNTVANSIWESKIRPIRFRNSPRFVDMDEKLVQKGSEQPLTKVGLDEQRSKSGQANDTKREDVGRFTDRVMEEQSKYHEVVRN